MKLQQEHSLEMETKLQLERHEAECAIRYSYVQDKLEGLDKRLWRLEAMVMMSTVAVISAVIALITQVV